MAPPAVVRSLPKASQPTKQRPQSSSRLFPALPLLTLISACCTPNGSNLAQAQQSPPLQGQGLSPFAAGVLNDSVPVYTSAELVRLMSIDEQEYEIKALLMVQQTWVDPRAPAIFNLIDSQDLLRGPSLGAQRVDESAVACGRALKNGTVDLESGACKAALQRPADCKKYCTTYGQTTDNPFRCCDLVWLPDISMPNLIDISQDRVVFDTLFMVTDGNISYVHRNTLITGRFFTPFKFKTYPFDQQQLFIFLKAQTETSLDEALFVGFHIVPSAMFRVLLPDYQMDAEGRPSVVGLTRDELAGWNIRNFTFTCTRTSTFDQLADAVGEGDQLSLSETARLQEKTQDYDALDPYKEFWAGTTREILLSKLAFTCTLTIHVSRHDSTLVAKIILPVAFVGALAFVVFFVSPENVDLRLSTEVSLFLALTATQFIFNELLPTTSYLTSFDVFILLTYSVVIVIVVESLVVYYIVMRADVWERLNAKLQLVEGAPCDECPSAGADSKPTMSAGTARGAPLVHRDSGNDKLESSMAEDGPFLSESASRCEGNGAAAQAPLGVPAGSALTPPLAAKGARTWLSHASKVTSGGVAGAARSLGSTMQPLARLGAMKRSVDHAFAMDRAFAHRISSRVDAVAGVLLCVAYVTLCVINFTVGFGLGRPTSCWLRQGTAVLAGARKASSSHIGFV